MVTNRSELKPVYDFTHTESTVLLDRGNVELRMDGRTYSGKGEIRMALTPRARLLFYGSFGSITPNFFLGISLSGKEIESFAYNGRQIEGFFTKMEYRDDNSIDICWHPSSYPIMGLGDDNTHMANVLFHIFNFVEFYEPDDHGSVDGDVKCISDRITMSSAKWTVEVCSLPLVHNEFELLQRQGGYRLTHLGRITTNDKSPFSGTDASSILNQLRYFLSFVKGCWCDPVCSIGFSETGDKVWELWSSPRELWRSPLSWFNPQHSHQISELFPGFISKIGNASWTKAIQDAIYWYVRGNDDTQGIDAGIILTQSAIERVSYEYAVFDRKILSGNGFKDLSGSDKYRILLASLGIPTCLPNSLKTLAKLKKQFQWQDGPHALTEIRNALIHPEHKNRGRYSDAYFEAWNLGLWYLELAILRICGYSGTYRNRLERRWFGEVDNVPWGL